MYECKICGFVSNSIKGLCTHLRFKHKDFTIKKYYDSFFKKQYEGICEECGNETKFNSFEKGYNNFCSLKCSSINENTLKKRKETCLEKYGTENHMQNDLIKNKIKETCLEKYGTNCSLNLNKNKRNIDYNKIKEEWQLKTKDEIDKINLKRKETCLEKYGVESTNSLDSVKRKKIKTYKNKYGVTNPNKNKRILEYRSKNRSINNFDKFVEELHLKNIKPLFNKNDILENRGIFKFKCLFCNNILEYNKDDSKYSIFSSQRISCGCKKSKSLKEQEVGYFLESNNIVFKTNILVENDNNKMELDIFVPDYRLAIEFDGLYWHSELFTNKNYHLNKTIECKKKGIQLIHIFEDEWINKRDIVQSIILSKLGIYSRRIYARKCQLKEILNDDYKKFCEENHIQGYVQAKIKIGLYYDNELVSIMSFGKNRFKKDEIELIRYCNKLNIQIIGGFSKILKYFVKNYKPEKLVSYCDRRYFDGSGYVKNGFGIISETNLNYFYFKNKKRFNRIQFQKHKLKDKLENFDSNLTEVENMINHGYLRIFDCGNLKMEYKGEY